MHPDNEINALNDFYETLKRLNLGNLGTVRANDQKLQYNVYMRRERITYIGAYHHVMNRGYDGNDNLPETSIKATSWITLQIRPNA